MASYWNEPNSSDRQEKPQDESLPKEIKDLEIEAKDNLTQEPLFLYIK